METGKDSASIGRRHSGKLTEGLLDTERILKALNIRSGQPAAVPSEILLEPASPEGEDSHLQARPES